MTEVLHSAPLTPGPAGPDPGETEAAGLTATVLSPGRLVVRRFLRHRLAVVSAAILGAITLIVIFAPVTARYRQQDLISKDVGHIQNLSPRGTAWFGTDAIGHDLYSRIIWGGRVSIEIGVAVALLSALIGTVIGSIAGYRGGLIDDVLMRVTDLFLAFPLLVALLVMRNLFAELHWLHWLFGDLSSPKFIIVLLSLVGWMAVARIVRGVVLSMKEREFVEAAKAIGSSDTRIIVRHLVPNALGPIIVSVTTSVAAAIITEATLSFFGYGVQASQGKASWGNLLADSKGAVQTGNWWIALYPALALVITVLCINFIGDGLRDAFDPKQRRNRA